MYAEAVLKVRGKFASAQGEDVLMLGEESRSKLDKAFLSR